MATHRVVGDGQVSVPPDEASLALTVGAIRLAAGLEARVGALADAVELGTQRPEPRGSAMRVIAADVPIEAGEATVTAGLSVTYQVEQE